MVQIKMNNINDELVEVKLCGDSFLVIKETLTRMGIPSYSQKKLFQSCHILHKRGKYYIVHFKSLFKLDGKYSTLSEDDLGRRNTISNLLAKWNLIELVNPQQTIEPIADIHSIKIISHKEKNDWQLVAKYNIGNRKNNQGEYNEMCNRIQP